MGEKQVGVFALYVGKVVWMVTGRVLGLIILGGVDPFSLGVG